MRLKINYLMCFIHFKTLNRLVVVLIFIGIQYKSAKSQSFLNYSTARNTSVSFSSISSSGNSVTSWRNTGSGTENDNRSYSINIGFDFWYIGVRYTSVSVSTNGFLDFSSNTDNGDAITDDFGPSNSSFTSPSAIQGTLPSLAIMYDDLSVSSAGLISSIKYLTSGSAPNRVFTVEWIGLDFSGNPTPDLNFQIQLFESTGVIKYNYGTMTGGTANYSYTCGLNATTMSGSPTNAQLKTQQTANTATFSNTQQNGLTTIPATNSQLVFTPVVPANPGSTLTFTSVGCSSMTLNWADWATNEVGYVIYNSTDNINFSFVTQTSAGATNTNITSLAPNINFYWKVYAVTEGSMSTALTGNRATTGGITKYSNNANASWNTAAHWSPAGVPSLCDNVIIKNGHTMTINTDAACNNLTVGEGASGSLLIGNNNSARTVIIGGDISVLNGGSLMTPIGSNVTHKLAIKGKINNSSTLNFRTDANSSCDVTFNGSVSSSITGTGATTNFNKITLTIGSSNADSLYVSSSNFTAGADFLVINTGKFHLATSNTSSFVFANAFDIHSLAGITINNTNATFDFQAGLSLEGKLKLIRGNLNIGNAADENLFINGGIFNMHNGAGLISGRLYTPNMAHGSVFGMTGGNLTLATSGSTSTTVAPFEISGSGGVFNMSGGTIIIQREGGTGAQNLGFVVTGTSGSNVTGGTLQIGNASTPAAQLMQINTIAPIGNLLVNSANASAQLLGNSLNVINDVTIASGSFNANTLNVTLGGDWSDNGTWTPSTGTVTFNGSLNHSLDKLNGTTENFNHLTTTGTGTLTLNDTISLTGNLTIGSGTGLNVGASNNNINLNGNFLNNGTYVGGTGKVTFRGTFLQTISTISPISFYDVKINNVAGVSISSGDYEIKNALFLRNGNFNVSAANSITLNSDAASTSRIAPVVSGSLTGNFTVERFISARAAGYSDMATPVLSTDMQDWDDELLLAYTYLPPTSYPSAWTYDEVAYDYVPITSATTNLTPGMGIEVWLDADGTWTFFDPTVVTSYGQPFIGSLNVSSSITNTNDGWNLIGNPYHSFISWDNLLASSSGIGSTIMMYDETIADFQTYSSGSGVEIAPHQGFWVQVTGADNLQFSESNKTTSTSSNYRQTLTDFTISLEKSNSLLPLKSHTIFRFSNDANVELDGQDITFKGLAHPLAPNLYSVIDPKKLRVNTLSYEDSTIIIPIQISVAETGTYNLALLNKDQIDFTGYQCKKIYDRQQQIYIDIEMTEAYQFEVTDIENHERFLLLLSKSAECTLPVSEQSLVSFIPNNGGYTIKVSESCSGGKFSLVNMLGQTLLDDLIESGGELFINLPTVSGIYHLMVETTGGIYTYKAFAP